MTSYPVKITFGEMREMGVRGVLVYCRHRCGHHTEISADGWADHVRGVLEKLGAKSRTDAAMQAVRDGLVDTT